jgi:hypothetical protein
MKRTGLLAGIGALGVTVGLLLVLPAAGATTTGVFRGVVLAKNAQRQTLVVSSASGLVRTVHVRLLRERVGARVMVRASRLRDGTFRALHVSIRGRASTAKIRRAVVVRQRPGRLIVSAGGSVFALSWAGRALSAVGSSAGLMPGTVISGTVGISTSGELDLETVSEDESGPSGDSGASGGSGPTGPSGQTGPSGPTGTSGDDQGENENPCATTGPSGASGASGATGASGAKGDNEGDDDQTDCTPTGTSGPTGSGDDQGDSCPPTGSSGVTGATGSNGDDQGENNNDDCNQAGPTGPSGATGPTGDQGDQGDQGDGGEGD